MDTLQVAKPMPVIFFITFLKIPPILRLLEIHNSIFTTFYLQMYLLIFANVPVDICKCTCFPLFQTGITFAVYKVSETITMGLSTERSHAHMTNVFFRNLVSMPCLQKDFECT